MPAKERTTANGFVNARITDQLMERINASAAENGRTRTAEMIKLVEAGLDHMAMTRGPNQRLLVDLFVASRAPGAVASRILDVLDQHFSWGELSTAMMNISRKHAS